MKHPVKDDPKSAGTVKGPAEPHAFHKEPPRTFVKTGPGPDFPPVEPLPSAAKVEELKETPKDSPDRPKAEAVLAKVEDAKPPTHAPGQRVRYGGQECEIVRDAMPGDDGYDSGKAKVLIRDWNGKEKAVARDEVQG